MSNGNQHMKGENKNDTLDCEQSVKLLKQNEEMEKIEKVKNCEPLKKKLDSAGSTSVFNKLKVVIWKNVIIRKRHWILTICEIAIPVILFIFLYCARSSRINGVDQHYHNETTYNSDWTTSNFYNEREKGDLFIFYTPKNQFTNSLIYKVQLKFNLNSSAVKDFSDESDLVAYYEKFATNKTVMGIVFKNLSNDETPKKLDYSIRPSEIYGDWNIDKLFDSFTTSYSPAGGSYAYIYKDFIAMQIAIDTSIIELLTNEEKLPFDLKTQEFPYPPYLDDGDITDMFFYILPFTTVFSFIFLYTTTIKRIVKEKRTGIKELMKMMGLKSWILWIGWFIHAFAVNFLSILIITLFMKVIPLPGTNYAVIKHCDASVFAIFLVLYTSAGITFCFAISSLFSSPRIAMAFGILASLLSYTITLTNVGKAQDINWGSRIGFSLFPNVALHFGFQAISVYESREVGSGWSNLFKSASGGKNDVTMGNVFVMFVVDIILYTLIAFYFERVKPGSYDLCKPLQFTMKFIVNKLKKKINNTQGEIQPPTCDSTNCKIEKPRNLKICIEVSNLYKKYGSLVAVNDFSINIYQDEITVLLGHNGAGKTTIMSIITGMIVASRGQVLINGVNIQQKMDQVRGYLGVCPQHNLLFTNLRVLEHLIFFGMLKGLSKQKAQKDAQTLLERLNLSSRANSLTSKLSEGLKRKLSLGITFMGDSTILILNEPTSGLDPEARKEIWKILLEFRRTKTIVITTNFMEEADILGDRIAIMDHGRLICYGTPKYLKKEYDTGYHLTLTCDPGMYDSSRNLLNQMHRITQIIQNKIPSAKFEFKSERLNQLTYLLLPKMKSYFGDLLSHLEHYKEELAISNISMSVTTLKEVFLKVGSRMPQFGKTDNNSIPSKISNSSGKLKGNKLLILQLKTLVNKRKLVTKRKWMKYLGIQILIALILTSLTLCLGSIDDATTKNFVEFNMNLKKYDETVVFYGTKGPDLNVTTMGQFYGNLVKQQKGIPHLVDVVSDAIIEQGVENIAYYKQRMIVAAEFNSTNNDSVINAMYANKALHGAPISLNLVMNAVIKTLIGDAYEISTSNNPLPMVNGNYFRDTSELQATMLWFILFPLALLFFSGTFLFFPQMEKSTSVKELQIMCGLKVYWYWITNYIFDLILYFVLVILILILVLVFGYPPYNGTTEIGALFWIMFFYGVCVIPYSYLFSYMKTAVEAFALYLIIGLFVSVTLTAVVFFLEFSKDKYYENIGSTLNYIFLLFPQYGLTSATVRFVRRAIENHSWNSDSVENRMSKCRFDYNPCCADLDAAECKAHQSYFIGKYDIFLNLIEMACSAFMYFIILLIVETRFVKKTWNTITDRLSNLRRKKGEGKDEDTVDRGNYDLSANDKDTLFQVQQLQKKYGDDEVVKRISFGVNSGDCFGLLGVNGAGKSTTIRMLTGFEFSTKGTVNIYEKSKERPHGLEISKHLNEYLQRVGYCPQFDAINEMLTGREMLQLFAELRGINGIDRDNEIEKWLGLLDLSEYKNKLCGKYSAGNKRKLSVAMALIGNPPLVILDEPTSAVDAVSRYKIWKVINIIKKQEVEKKPAIILATHSLEECEVLCNKLTIMKEGQLQCIGTISKLKEKYSQGFTVKLELKIPTLTVVVNSTNDDIASVASQSQLLNSSGTPISTNLNKNSVEDSKKISELKDDFERIFNGNFKLCNRCSGLFHYHLGKSLKWGDLFEKMEALKRNHSIIEDYCVSETTLKEVFLSDAGADQ